jgi:hypothetical protein
MCEYSEYPMQSRSAAQYRVAGFQSSVPEESSSLGVPWEYPVSTPEHHKLGYSHPITVLSV